MDTHRPRSVLLSRKKAAQYLTELGLERWRKRWRGSFMRAPGRSARTLAIAPCTGRRILTPISPVKCRALSVFA